MTHMFLIAAADMVDFNIPVKSWTGFLSLCTVLGLFVGGVIAFFATRAERKKIGEAHKETNKVYEQTITAQKEFIDTVQTTHLAQIKLLQSNNEKMLEVISNERDNYRKKSHDLAGELHACGLIIKEYELKPDLTTLYHLEQQWHEQRESFYNKMFESQTEMLKTQQATAASMQEFPKVIQQLVSQVAHLIDSGKTGDTIKYGDSVKVTDGS